MCCWIFLLVAQDILQIHSDIQYEIFITPESEDFCYNLILISYFTNWQHSNIWQQHDTGQHASLATGMHGRAGRLQNRSIYNFNHR